VRLVGTKVDAQRRQLWACAQLLGGDNRVWVFARQRENRKGIPAQRNQCRRQLQ
jgi:hypothetical protein